MKEQKTHTVKEIIAGIIGVLFLWIVFTVSCESKEDKVETKPEFSKEEAFSIVKRAVTEQLVSPSTADFPWYDDGYVNQIDDSLFVVKSYVDSQNGFGAMIRSNFTCRVIYNKKTKTADYEDLTIK